MKPKSAIEKGKRFENWFCQQLDAYGIDSSARREIGSGSGKRKGDIATSMDYLPELKNQSQVSWLSTIDQAKAQAKMGFHNPDKWITVVRDPRSPEFNDVYVTMDVHQFLRLYRKSMTPKVENPDKAVSYKIQRLIQSAKDVLKEIQK